MDDSACLDVGGIATESKSSRRSEAVSAKLPFAETGRIVAVLAGIRLSVVVDTKAGRILNVGFR